MITVPLSVSSLDVSLAVLRVRFFHSLAIALLSTTNLVHVDKHNCYCCICVCAMASKFSPGTILVWVVTIESYVLGGVLGRYIQGSVTFKGALLFSVYSISQTECVGVRAHLLGCFSIPLDQRLEMYKATIGSL